jgi:hypothetical protein
LIIRKNNYVTTGNGGSNERGSLKEIDNSPFNKTSNFNTLMNAGGTNQRLNNTNSFFKLLQTKIIILKKYIKIT